MPKQNPLNIHSAEHITHHFSHAHTNPHTQHITQIYSQPEGETGTGSVQGQLPRLSQGRVNIPASIKPLTCSGRPAESLMSASKILPFSLTTHLNAMLLIQALCLYSPTPNSRAVAHAISNSKSCRWTLFHTWILLCCENVPITHLRFYIHTYRLHITPTPN